VTATPRRTWTQLRRLWLATGDRKATSVTFLVDQAGIIRFVHPGPEYYPSQNAADQQQNDDYQLLDAAIAALVGSPAGSGGAGVSGGTVVKGAP